MSDLDDNLFDDTLFDNEPDSGGQFEDFDDVVDDSRKRRRGGGNRNFIIAVGVLVGIFLISLIALVVFAGLVLPQRNAQRQAEAERINAANTATAGAATAQAVAMAVEATQQSFPSATLTAGPLPATDTPLAEPEASVTMAAPTETQVVAQPTMTETPAPTDTQSLAEEMAGDPAAHTATIAALLTLSAGGGQDVTTVPVGSTPLAQAEAMTATARATESGSTYYYPTVLPETGFADEVGLPGLLGGAALLIAIIILVRRLRLSR